MSSDTESVFTIHVTCGPKSHMFEVQPSHTIQSIKEKLSKLTKVRENNILLLLNGAYLDPESTIRDYEIYEDITLAYEIKLCGPKPIDFDWSKFGVPAAPKKVTGGQRVKKVTEL